MNPKSFNVEQNKSISINDNQIIENFMLAIDEAKQDKWGNVGLHLG